MADNATNQSDGKPETVGLGKGVWFRARHNVHFGPNSGKGAQVIGPGEFFQLDNKELSEHLLETGAITEATQADADAAKKAKGKKTHTPQDEIIAGKAADGQGTQRPSSLTGSGGPENPPPKVP